MEILSVAVGILLGVVTNLLSDVVKERKLDPWGLAHLWQRADRLTDGDLLWAVRQAFRRAVQTIGQGYLRRRLQSDPEKPMRRLVEERLRWLDKDTDKLLPSAVAETDILTEAEIRAWAYSTSVHAHTELLQRLAPYLDGTPGSFQDEVARRLPELLSLAFSLVIREEGRGKRAYRAFLQLLVEGVEAKVDGLARQLEAEWHLYRVPGVDRAVWRHYLANFAGRHEVLARIDEFLTTEPRGYLSIAGHAGRGKTALAIHLAAMRDYPLHLLGSPWAAERRAVGLARNTPEEVVRNLGGQIAQRFGLEHVPLRGGARELRDAFHNLLAELGRRPSPTSEDPLVIVLDGMDEAVESEGVTVWNLLPPADALPMCTYFLLTGRPTAGWSQMPGRHPSLQLPPLGIEDLCTLLRTADDRVTRDAGFLAQVMEVSGGSPLYLRHLVEDIVAWGGTASEHLTEMPGEVRAYYFWQFELLDRGIRETRYEVEAFDILWLLALAREPLSKRQIVRITGMRSVVFDRALAPIHRFILGDERYGLVHPVFRDAVRAQFSARVVEEERAAFVERLLDYCRSWHGHELDEDRGYALRNCAEHLAEAGRWEELHTLVASGAERQEWAEGRYASEGSYVGYLADLQRAWQRAESDDGWDMGREIRYALIESSIRSLSENLSSALVLQLVETELWSPAAALANIETAATEPHCVEVLERIARLMPAELGAEALRVTRGILDDESRSKALVALVRHLPVELAAEAAYEALTTADTVTFEPWRAALLRRLAERLPDNLPDELKARVLAAAQGIQIEWQRADALSGLVGQLPDDLKASAVAAAREIADENARARALSGLMGHLPVDLQAEVLRAVLEIENEWWRAKALQGVATHIPDALKPEALAAAREMAYGPACVMALNALADCLPDELRAEVLREALDRAREISDDEWRAEALTALAARLRGDLKDEAADGAFRAIRRIQEERSRAQKLGELAVNLPDHLKAEALEVACRITDSFWRDLALGKLGWCLPGWLQPVALTAARKLAKESAPEALIGLVRCLPDYLKTEALAAAREVPDDGSRAKALTKMAGYLSDELRIEVLADVRAIASSRVREWALGDLAMHMPAELKARVVTEALTTARGIAHKGQRALALRHLANHLPDLKVAALREALKAEQEIGDEAVRAQAVGFLVECLPDELIAEKLAAVQEIGQVTAAFAEEPVATPRDRALATLQNMDLERLRTDLLIGLMSHLPDELQADVFEVVRGTTREWERTRALMAMVAYLSDGLKPEVLRLVQEAADEGRRSFTLIRVVPFLPDDLKGDALAVAQEITNPYLRGRTLGDLAGHLPADLKAEAVHAALAAVREMPDEQDRASVLGDLGDHLPDELKPEVLETLRCIADARARAWALEKFSQSLPEETKANVLAEALAAARAIGDQFWRFRVLNGLAGHLPGGRKTEVLREALAIVEQMTDDWRRARALTELAERLPRKLMGRALRAALELGDEVWRAGALTALVDYLPDRLKDEAIAKIFDALAEIPDEKLRSQALIDLADHLPSEFQSKALEVVRQMAEPEWRAGALIGLLDCLCSELTSEALAVVRELPDKEWRARALIALVDYLPDAARVEVLSEAMAATRGIADDWDRAELLSRLVTRLPSDKLRAELLRETLETAMKVWWGGLYGDARAALIARIVSNWRESRFCDLEAIWDAWPEALHMGARDPRPPFLRVLGGLAPFVADLGGAAAIAETIGAIQDVGRWWP